MKKLNLGQTLGILANVGVIAGIIFLAVELQQNNAFLAAEARADRRDIARDAALRELNYPELRRARIKAASGERLDANEQNILNLDNNAAIIDWQYIYLEYQLGLLEESTIPLLAWQRSFQEPSSGMREYWSATKSERNPDFVQWMEENVVN